MNAIHWSTRLAGDPLVLSAGITTLDAVRGSRPDWTEPPRWIAGPAETAVALALGPPGSRIEWWWIALPHAPALAAGVPVRSLVWIRAPFAEAAGGLGIAASALALAGDPQRLAAARTARTRQELVNALAADPPPGESTLTTADVLELLATSPTGLGAAESVRRRALAGENRLQRVRRRPGWLRLLEQFWSFFAILLWIGGAFAILAGMPQLGVAVFVVILVNGVFSFFQEYRAERALETLEDLLPRSLVVRRDGQEAACPAVDLVPGDVVRIEEGDAIPADGQVLESHGLRLDQGSLTGEPHPVFKRPVPARAVVHAPPVERPERVFAGTSVISGDGLVVVTGTGMHTEIGAIAHLTQTVGDDESPLQKEMRRVTRAVAALAVGLGLAFFALGVGSGRIDAPGGFFFALGVIVANVPEGLLPTLTLALALGVQRMARHGSLIRRLSAVETLGAVQVICTDKTGTLTENRMTARFAWTPAGTSDLDAAAPPASEEAEPLRELFAAAVRASVATREHGDPTERALVEAAERLGLDVAALRQETPVLAALSFDSFRKRMTLVRASAAGAAGPAIAWVKGAPRELLQRCVAIRTREGVRPLGADDARAFLAVHDRLATEGLRLLAVARREVAAGAEHEAAETLERDLVLLGGIALWDPPRAEVPESIALCRRAGIHVVVLTGDYGLTARALAGRIGLGVSRVVEGDEIDRLSREALGELALTPGVLFARVSPAHKLAVVRALREDGLTVAVTGDGVNDAPALKAADIGVAMGRRGSDVAKEAAEMVLTDDHFASIVAAVQLGRGIWANVGRFVTYVFASNVAELVPFLAFVLFRVPLPLTVMQVLAVDLGTDLLPALALGAERPEPGSMDRPPRPRTERLLGSRRLLLAYGWLGVIEAALAMLAFFWVYWLAGWRPGLPFPVDELLHRRATTMTLAGIVAGQVGNAFACRTDRESVFRVGLFGNRMLLAGIAAELALLLALVTIPPLARAFGTAPPRWEEWRLLLAFPAVVFLAEEARKWIARSRTRQPAARASVRGEGARRIELAR